MRTFYVQDGIGKDSHVSNAVSHEASQDVKWQDLKT